MKIFILRLQNAVIWKWDATLDVVISQIAMICFSVSSCHRFKTYYNSLL